MFRLRAFGVLALAIGAVVLSQETYGAVGASAEQTVVGGAPCSREQVNYDCVGNIFCQNSVTYAAATTVEKDKTVTAAKTKELCRTGAFFLSCNSYKNAPDVGGCVVPNTSGVVVVVTDPTSPPTAP